MSSRRRGGRRIVTSDTIGNVVEIPRAFLQEDLDQIRQQLAIVAQPFQKGDFVEGNGGQHGLNLTSGWVPTCESGRFRLTAILP